MESFAAILVVRIIRVARLLEWRHRSAWRCQHDSHYDGRAQWGLPSSAENHPAMRSLGRTMQWLGLAFPPLAMFLQLSEAITLGQMLTILVASVCLFGIGRIVEGYA